jgi:spore maturation protein CgeB
LATKLELLINNQNLATEIAKNAFEKVRENYSMDQVGKILQNELEKITEK